MSERWILQKQFDSEDWGIHGPMDDGHDHVYPMLRTPYKPCAELMLAILAERDALVAERDRQRDRHYVCEAHAPLGEPGNHDDVCPCCVAVEERRLREAERDALVAERDALLKQVNR